MKRNIFGFWVVLLFIILNNPVYALQSGQIEYTVPIDYSLIDENILNNEAETLFKNYLSTTDEQAKKAMLERLLSDYSILSQINKDNPLYFVRLGIIFDKMGKDRYAKSNFCRGSNLVPDYPYAFHCFGNYFFDRAEYKKALREYKRAFDCGYNNNYDNIYRIAVIYEKFGDYSTAIKYYKLALICKNSEELTKKIHSLEELLQINSLYNQSRGLYK
ncbi:MAG: tetratricopeptide repeat protein [Candidatus Gastranaerophilales bacterium]|nr:tetratricopeptide repeat protein [Candidatus Gastranaerophilales bacterium]